MGTLGQMSQGLTLNNTDSLDALLNGINETHLTGGIAVYTITHTDSDGLDYRSSNLSKNYNNGQVLRANKSDIRQTNSYAYNEKGNLEVPSTPSDFIGRLYGHEDTTNSNLKFITEDGFLKFEGAIRERNLLDIADNRYFHAVGDDYSVGYGLFYDGSKVPEKLNIGDLYSVGPHKFKHFHPSLFDLGFDFRERLQFYTKHISSVTSSDGKYGVSSDGDIYAGEVANYSQWNPFTVVTMHNQRTYIRTLKNVKKFGEAYFNGGVEYREFFEGDFRGLDGYRIYGHKLNYWNSMPNQGTKANVDGFFDYYGVKNVNISYLKTEPVKLVSYGEFRATNLEYNKNGYQPKNPYAIGSIARNDEDALEFYGVGSIKRDFNSNIERGNGGSINDSYYSETEEKNTTPTIVSNDADYNINSLLLENNKGKTFVNIVGDNYSKLIRNTNKMFSDMKIGSLINRFHTSSTELHDYNNDELVSAKSEYGLSRGRNLLAKEEDKSTGYSNPYCRVWTAHHRYGKLSRLIRPFSDAKTISDAQGIIKSGTNLRPNNGASRLANGTVLQNDGFVRMSSQYDKDGNLDIKNYMFSIENLAWRNANKDLSEEQKGSHGGRIMWFPPYNLKFTENVNVDWSANKFIGRGEQIYTYTNTDRSGTLSFTLLIDHPSLINKWRGLSEEVDDPKERENEILRFFAGCNILDGVAGSGTVPFSMEPQSVRPKTPKLNGKTKNVAVVVFFPNNFSGYNERENVDNGIDKLISYENSSSGGWEDEEDIDIENEVYSNENISKYNLNNSSITEASKNEIKKIIFNGVETEFYQFFDTENGYLSLQDRTTGVNGSDNGSIFGETGKNIKIDVVEIYGFASSHGNETNNKKLYKRRGDFMKSVLRKYCKNVENVPVSQGGRIISVSDAGSGPNRDINSLEAKIARSAYILFKVKWDEDATTNSSPIETGNAVISSHNYDAVNTAVSNVSQNSVSISRSLSVNTTAYKYDNEYLYFSSLRNDEAAYQRVIDKIRYFNPAFHSVTPEGFNARLTFLHQCTRQGPTVDLSSGEHNSGSTNYVKYAGNLSFGRAPYCILRIGDFFHTKICITSLSIDYDNGGGVQWDLNPEGIGVQPMFANVNINFNFIGGQDIKGPVEILQNAVSYNYYANASIYDIRSKEGR